MSRNNVAQKAALSLSDKHQTGWGREEVQNIFYVENWKAFNKCSNLLKPPPNPPPSPSFGFFEEKSLYKHPPRCFALFWVFFLRLLTYVKRLMGVAVTEAGTLLSCFDVNSEMSPQSIAPWGPNTNETVIPYVIGVFCVRNPATVLWLFPISNDCFVWLLLPLFCLHNTNNVQCSSATVRVELLLGFSLCNVFHYFWGGNNYHFTKSISV